MKRLVIFVLSFTLLVLTTACAVQTRQDNVLDSLGKYESNQIWTHGGFQDYADYGRYTYSSQNLDKNQYFTKISESDIETICAFVDDFEEWIDTFRNNDPNDELVLNYAFDRSIIDTEDYFYIFEGENYPKYGCYDVWFFDTQTNILYYFHNNI